MEKAQAVEFFGGPTKLGELLGITRQAIHAWPPVVPDLYQYKLHYLSDGRLPIDPALLARAQPPTQAPQQ